MSRRKSSFRNLFTWPFRFGLVFLLCAVVAFLINGCNKNGPLISNSDSEGMVQTGESGLGDSKSLQQQQMPNPSVAVIDVNEVARKLGLKTEIDRLVTARENDLQQRFNLLQQKLAKDYELIATSITGTPTPQQRSDLLLLQQQHMNELTAEWNKIHKEIEEYQEELREDFVASVRPVTRAIAKQKGIPTVLTMGQVFLAAEPCDITSEVAAEMQRIMHEASREPDESDDTDTR